jgi:hypothetical protein
MLAAMHGKIGCVLKLLQAGANVSEPTNFPAQFRLQMSLTNHGAYLTCASDLDV